MAFHPVVQALFDWLVDGAPGAPTPMAVLARVGPDLVSAGVPLARMTAFVRTLHPSIMGRSFAWTDDAADVEVREASWALLESAEFKLSPVARVFQTGELVRRRLDAEVDFADLKAMREKGFTDYAAFPLKFMGGSVHAVTFATRAPGGFGDADLAALGHVVRPLSRVGETLALMRTAVNLLNAYVGNDAGDRILKGQIQRGDTQNIDCVIWFSDLRGFTRLSGERTPTEIISVLNEFFDCQVPAIERAGGQVLKFIGDGLLAIFPLGKGRSLAEVGAAAVRASREAMEALTTLNAARASRGDAALAFGVALHVGEVAYGNIGGAGRLDFTAIGPAVNLASRIEGLTGKLGKPVLLSGALAAALSSRSPSAGTFELKGVAGTTEVFEP